MSTSKKSATRSCIKQGRLFCGISGSSVEGSQGRSAVEVALLPGRPLICGIEPGYQDHGADRRIDRGLKCLVATERYAVRNSNLSWRHL